MGHIITKFLGWHVYNEVIDNGIDGGDLLIDDLCSRIAANQTAAAIRIIKSVPNVNKLSKRFHLSPLHMAIETGNVNCIEMLLRYSADVNIKDCRLFSPLHIAAEARRVTAFCVQMLLDAGADVAARDVWGKTPLHRAAICAHYEVLHILLKSGGDINMKDGQDRSCFMYLAHYPPSNNLITEMVLEHGADVNSKDKRGRSPLYFAVLSRQLPLMELLIQKGADLNDQEPMKLAVSRCHEDCVQLLLSHGAVLSLDIIQIVLNRFKCGHRIDQPMLDVLQKYISLLKLLLAAFGEPLSLDCIRSSILELLFFINALKNQASVQPVMLSAELSQVVPIISLLVSVNSVPLQVIQPLLSMFEEHCLLQQVEKQLGYTSIPPLMHYCRTCVRQELAKDGVNLLYTIDKLTSLPLLMRNFITVKESMD